MIQAAGNQSAARGKELSAATENEKTAIQKVQKLREQIEQVNADIQKAEHAYDLGKAAELKYGKLPSLKEQLAKEEEIADLLNEGESILWEGKPKKSSFIRPRSTEEISSAFFASIALSSSRARITASTASALEKRLPPLPSSSRAFAELFFPSYSGAMAAWY